MTSQTRFRGFRAQHVATTHRPYRSRRQPPPDIGDATPCDICDRAASWRDSATAFCRIHAPIAPTDEERAEMAAAGICREAV